MKKLFIPMVTVLFLAVACVDQHDIKDELPPTFTLDYPSLIPEGHYEVYSIVLDSLFLSRDLVVQQKSRGYTEFSYHSLYFMDSIEEYPLFDSTLVHIHDSLNKDNVFFDLMFTCDSNEVQLISEDELAYVFGRQNDEGWDYFHERYPDSRGTVSFTRIALNHDKNQAAFEVAMTYGYLGAHSYIVYLIRENDTWRIAEIFNSGVVS